MKWKEVLKANCGTHKTDEKMLYGGQKKLDKDKDGKITGKDFAMLRRERVKKNIEEEILEEVEDEGGALGMKNLKILLTKRNLKKPFPLWKIERLFMNMKTVISILTSQKENRKER